MSRRVCAFVLEHIRLHQATEHVGSPTQQQFLLSPLPLPLLFTPPKLVRLPLFLQLPDLLLKPEQTAVAAVWVVVLFSLGCQPL